MNDKIQKALINRQERLESKKIFKTDDKISNALEKRQKRIISNLDTTLIALQKDINKEIQVYNNLQKLNFGYDTNIKALESTNSSRVQIGKLKNTVEAHRKYIGDDSADMLLSTLNEISEGYNNYLSAAKQYSNFNSENDYNAYVMNNTAELEDGMSAEGIAARIKAYEKSTARLESIDNEIANMSDEEKWTKKASSGSGRMIYSTNVETKKYKALLDEKEYLEEQIRLYKKYNKENDSLVSQFADSADFKVNSVYVPRETRVVEDGLAHTEWEHEWAQFLSFYNDSPNLEDHLYVPEVAIDALEGKQLPDEYYNAAVGLGWNFATEDEFKMLNFLANTQGDEAAQRYYDVLLKDLSRRKYIDFEKKRDENYKNANWIEKAGLNISSVPEKILGGLTSGAYYLTTLVSGEEYDPYNQINYVSAMGDNTRKNTAIEIEELTNNAEFLGVSWGDAYQAAMSGIDSVVGAATFGKGYTVIMGMGAASSKAKQLYEQGASNGQIAAASLLSGVTEMAFEKFSIGHFLDEFVNAPTKKWYKLLGQTALQGGIEMTEEMATELSNIFTDVMVLGSRSEWEKLITSYKEQGYSDWEAISSAMWDKGGDILEAGIMGFISGTGMGAGGSVINAFNTNKAYNEFYTQIGSDITSAENIKSLVAAAKTLDNSKSNAKVKALAAELEGVDVSKLNAKEKTAFEKKAGQLYEAVLEAQNKQGKASFDTAKKNIIREQLNKKGITDEKEIEAATQAIMKVVYNKGALTAKESELLEKVGGNEIASYLINNAAEATTEGIITALNNKAVINDTKSLTKKQNTYAREINIDDYIYSGDGKTYIDGENTPVDISGIASIKNGRMTLELSDGRTAELGDVILGSETQAILYEGVLDMGVDAASAQAIVNSYDENAELGALKYVYGMRQAVEYGKIGAKAFLDTGAFTADLNAKQREMAYEIGRMTAENEAKREAERKQRASGNSEGRSSGGIRFDGITESELDETQKTIVNVFKHLFGGYGVTIEFFKSAVDERGAHTGENGSYDPDTNTIRLDINAGAQGKDTILFTAAHELTHFIKQWSPEKFRVFGEFLLNSYAKHGVSIDDLIKKQQAKAKRNGRELDYEAAYEEVVADSCETFLRDSKLFDKLLNLKEKDKRLFEKTKEYISKLFDKVATLRHKYRNFNPDSKEGNLVTQMTDAIQQLHRLWEDAAMTALENSRRASGTAQQKNTAEKGGEVVRLSQRDNSDNSIKEQLKANLNILNLMETVASVQEFKTFEYKQQTLEWVLKRLENTGYKVNRKGFGEIIIDDKRIKSGLRYSKTNEEKLGFAVLPQVLAKGVEIDTHIKHKNRAYDTVTFAAPVVINGQRGNMAVVVRQEGKNYYKVHRLVMPDGSQFILNKKRDTAERAGGVEINSGLSPTDNVSKNNIPDSTEKVKDNVKKSDRDVRDSVSKMVGENGKTQKNTADSDSGVRFSERDYPIDAGVAAIVNNSVSAKKVTSHILSTITAEQNKAINRLNNQSKNDLYRGKYTGGKHRFSDTMIKHALKEHGDFLREGLRAQLPITKKDIARHLSAIKDNKSPSTIKPTKTKRGAPSIVTSYEINGYTLYAEEITKSLGKNLPSDLIGHTMYKAPTLATAAALATSARAQPKRQSTVLCSYYMSSKGNLSTANFIADKNGNPALLSYATKNSNPKVDVLLGGLIALSSDKNNFTDMSGDIEQGYVRCRKPFYITQDNKVFSNSETDVAAKLSELKAQGYDCFVFDYNIGDNYLVAVFNEAQIVKNTNGNVIPVSKKTDNTDDKTMRSDRDPAFVSEQGFRAENSLNNIEDEAVSKDNVAFSMPIGKRRSNIYKNVVELSKDNELSKRIFGLYSTEKYKEIQKYIFDVLGGQNIVLSDGKKATVDKSDARHISQNAGSKKAAQISAIKELVEKAVLIAEEESNKGRKFDYFYYYEAAVKYDGEIFNIYLNVGRATNDKSYHLYDITQKLRDTAHRINGVGRPKLNEGYALKNGISNNIIYKTANNVNNDYSTNTDIFDDEVRFSLKIKHANSTVEEIKDARNLTDEQAVEYLKQAKRGELRRETYIPIRKDTPSTIINTLGAVGIDVQNRSLIMQVRKAQQAMSSTNNGSKSKKHGNNIRSHGMSAEQIVDIVKRLDNPTAMILQTNRYNQYGEELPDNVAVFVEYNNYGKEGVAIVEFDSSIDSEFIGTEFGDANYHTVVTIFEPDTERYGMPFDYIEELLANPDNYELEIVRRQPARSATGEKHPNTSSELPSSDIIFDDLENVNNINSTNTDNIEYERLNDKEQNYIQNICDKLGRTVVFEDLREMYYKGEIISPDGYIENGIIHLNLYAENPIGFVFKHELTHFAEKASGYAEFVRGVKNSNVYKKWLCEKMGESDMKIAEYKYKQMVANTHSDIYSASDPKAEAEMIADFVGEMLFTENGSGMLALTAELDTKPRNAVVRFITDFISWLKKKFINGQSFMTYQLSVLEDGFNHLLSEATNLENNSQHEDNNVKFSIAGEHSKTANHSLLFEAKLRAYKGDDSETIRKDTGWYKGRDGKWRYYIPDNELNIDHLIDFANSNEDVALLGDVMTHDKFFAAYPELRNVRIRFDDIGQTKRGKFSSDKNEIVLNIKLKDNVEKIKDTLVHETQHAIQYTEGFALGGNKNFGFVYAMNLAYDEVKNTSEFKRLNTKEGKYDLLVSVAKKIFNAQNSEELRYKAYRSLYGEVEARQVTRNRLFDEEVLRLATPDTSGNVVDVDNERIKFVENFTEMGYTEEEVLNLFRGEQSDKSGSIGNIEDGSRKNESKFESVFRERNIGLAAIGIDAIGRMDERGTRNDGRGVQSEDSQGNNTGGMVGGIVTDKFSSTNISNQKADSKESAFLIPKREYIQTICDKLGRTVVFEDLREMYYKGEIISPDGYIENGVIHLNTYAKNPIGFVFKHELTHFAEKASGYLEFVRGVKNSNVYKKWLCEKMGESDVKIAEYKYKQMVANIHSDIYSASDPKAEAEMIADFVGEMLFTENGSGMVSLVSDVEVKQRNKVVQFVLDLISYLKKKLSGMNSLTLELSRLEDRFNELLYENEKIEHVDNNIRFSFNNDKTESSAIITIIKKNIEKISDYNKFIVQYEELPENITKSNYVFNIFKTQGEVAYNKYIGKVELTKSGAKSTVFHGFGKSKLAATKAIKTVIEHGNIISITNNYNNTGIDRYVIAAKGVIDDNPAYIGVVVKAYPNNKKSNAKFYLHEALIIETASPIMTATQLNADTVSETASNNIITNSDEIVNYKTPRNTDNIEYDAINEQEQNYIQNICDKLGRTVVFEDLREMYYKGEIISPDGYIENGVIHLNTYAENPIGFVFKHELTHFVEKARGYSEFVRGVQNSNVYKKWLCEKMGESDVKIAEYKYKQMVANTHSDIYSASDPKAEAEMIADFVGEMLFTENGSGMASLVSDVEVKHRSKVVQFVLDLISYLKKKLSGMHSLTLELSILEDSFNRIVSEATDLENKGLYKYDNDISFCFVACTDQERIKAAEELERQGYNRLYIFKNCGLIRDAYGKWKYELNTREFKFYPDGNARTDSHYFNYKLQKPDGSFKGRLCDFVLFNSLFELYPQLKDITVIIKKADDTVRFIIDKNDENDNDKEPILFINKRLSDDFKSSRNNDIKSYILRELQRAIQHINGEYIGKSLTYWENKEKESKTPYSEKLGRKLTAQEAHKYTADNYEAKIVETRRALRDTILKTDANKGRNLSNIDEAYLYSSSVERDMDILFDDNDNPFISKEYLLPSKDNSISDNNEGTTAENEVVPSLPDGTEENDGNSFEVALKKNQNSNELRRFLSAARMIDKNDIAQNLNIRAGSDSLISNVADNAKQAAEYFNRDRINELSQKILQRIDSIGRALSDYLLEKFKNTIFKNEKGQMTSLYTLKMRGVGGFEHSKLGLVAGTLEAAEQLYAQYNDGSPRNRDVYIQEIFVNMKNPLVLNYTPYEDSIRGIHDLVEREILFHSEFINLINQKNAAKEPTYSGLTTRKTREAIQNAGYDGIIYFNDSTDKGSMTVIVFDESQMITVAENGILQQNNGIMEDYFDLAAAEDAAKKVNNDKNIKLYTADSKYNKRKYRPIPDERIKAGNSGFMEKVTRGVVNAKRELEENLAGNNEIALSGKDTVGRTFGKKITGECDKTFFKDKNGTLLSFFAYGKKIIDLEKAIKSRTFFGTLNSAINDLVLSKEKSPRSLFGVIQEFYINSVAPLVVELDNLDVEAIAKQIFEEKIITEKEYYRIISPERKNPALVLINKLDQKGFDCIVFAKQTGECAVLPFDASQVFPVADNGIVKENSNVTQVDEIEEYNENYRIDRVVIEREGETPIDTQEIRNILTTEHDNTIKMKLVTKVLMCNNNPAIDYSDNRTAGHSGILEKNKVNILNARAIVTALINRDFSDISIADTDTAGRIVSERKRQFLRESKFVDKDGRPLSVFGFNRYGDYRFNHSQFGLRLSTLNAAHDTSLFERENSAGYIVGSFEEYYPIVKNPYFFMFDPENLTPAMLAEYLLEEGTITNKQYEGVLVRLGADRTAYHSGASNYLTRILKEKGFDSLAFMNERADPGSIGLIVFDKSQLIPVAIDGLLVENSDRTLADSDNEPAFLTPENDGEIFVEMSQLESVENFDESGIIEETVDNDTGVPGEYTDEIVWSIFKHISVRKCGKGYYGTRIKQSDLRVDNYELKINPNDESYYLQHPDGRYVQFENMKNSTLQDAKLAKSDRSYYHVERLSSFMKQQLVNKAKRQLETANAAGYKLEWIVSDKTAVEQLTRFFAEQDMDIIVTYCPE